MPLSTSKAETGRERAVVDKRTYQSKCMWTTDKSALLVISCNQQVKEENNDGFSGQYAVEDR